MRSFGCTLVLLLLCGGLGLALWLSGRGAGQAEDSLTVAVLDGRPLMGAASIRFSYDSEMMPLEFERDADGVWMLVEPLRDLASRARIEGLAAVYDSAQLVPVYGADEIDERILSETGLDDPRGKLRVRWPDGHQIELGLGEEGVYGRDLFALRDGEIWRVQKGLYTSLRMTPKDARDPFVFRNGAAQVAELRLIRRIPDGDSESIALSRRRSGPWLMSEPAELRINHQQADQFVQALVGLQIAHFLPGRPSDLTGPVAPADAVIELNGMVGRERIELRRQANSGLLFGSSDRRDHDFAIEEQKYRALLEVPVKALRAHWLLSFAVDDADGVQISGGERVPIALERGSGSGFRLLQPIDAPSHPTAVSELMQALRRLAVAEFVEDGAEDLAPYGLDSGYTDIVIRAERHRAEDRLLLGADRGDGLTWLRRADEPHVVAIRSEVAKVLRRPWTDYVDRRVMRLDSPSLVRAILLEQGDATLRFERGEDGDWRAEGEEEPRLILDEILDLLAGLTAEQVLGADGLEWQDERRIALRGVADRRLGEVLVGRDADGRYLARLDGVEGYVFQLKQRDGRDLLGDW